MVGGRVEGTVVAAIVVLVDEVGAVNFGPAVARCAPEQAPARMQAAAISARAAALLWITVAG